MLCLLWIALGIVTETPQSAFSANEELEWIARPGAGFFDGKCEDVEWVDREAGLYEFGLEFIKKPAEGNAQNLRQPDKEMG